MSHTAPVTYYPAQSLSVAGTQLKLVQSADIDFSIKREDVFEFGTFWTVDNIQVEPATANLNFSYALSPSANNHQLLGLNSFGDFISDTEGKQYVLSGAGVLTMPHGYITSFAVDAAVGGVPTVKVGVQALEVTYVAGVPVFPNQGGSASVSEVVRPDQISVTLGINQFECRSFSFNLDMSREYVNKLGSLSPIDNIMTAPPKVSIEAEVILRDSTDPKFGNNDSIDASILCGGVEYSVNSAKMSNFTTKSSLNGVQVATVKLEAPVKGYNQISIGG
jgi:hypothetical protein